MGLFSSKLNKKSRRSNKAEHGVNAGRLYSPSHHLVFEPLEPRILMSADAIGGSFDAQDVDFGIHTMAQSPDDMRGALELKLLHRFDSLADSGFVALGGAGAKFAAGQDYSAILKPIDLDSFALLVESTVPVQPVASEIIIVDSDVPDAAQLLAQLQQNSAVHYQVHFLEAGSSGVAQVSAILAQQQAVAAVHILSHGGAGELQLGDDVLTERTVGHFENELRQWQVSLTESADILLYGCDLAGNTSGQSLLATLAEWTAADIAASEDKTGAANLGGDWHLEFKSGAIESALTFAADDTQWQHTLATITVTSSADTGLAVGVDSVAELLASGDPITLRQAISVVNADFHDGDSTVHTIEFNLQGDYNIVLAAALPSIDAAVVIDGTSETAYTDTPLVTITGSATLLRIDGDGITVRGLVLEGSGSDGIKVTGDNNFIVGNLITGNSGDGIDISGQRNTVGGTSPEDRNVISGNARNGIYIAGSYAEGNVVLGNYIGTTVGGNGANGNQLYGVRIENIETAIGADTTFVGGLVSGAGNLISGNNEGGVYLGTAAYHVEILGNRIGVAADGATPLGNSGAGITVKTGANAGDFTPSDILIKGNRIAHNSGAGVSIEGIYTFNVRVEENLIYGNADLGIDLGANGVTLNDPGDADVGVNAQSNFPVINSVTVVDSQLRIVGTLSNNQEISPITIHFYYASTAHISNHGGAEGYIGSVTVAPGASINFDRLFATMVPDGSYITATATGNLGTSEFATNYYLATGNLVNLDPVGMPSISGTLIQGALLTASHNISDGNGRSGPVNYQWQRNGVNISGATADSYVLLEADVGATIRVVASYTDDDGFVETVSSIDYGPVANINDAPLGAVTIVGTAQEGQTLTAQNSLTDADGNPTAFNYQWYRDGVEITGAAATTYVLAQADVGQMLTVAANYIDGQGTAENIFSNPTDPVTNVNDAPVGGVTITGVAAEDETLNATLAFIDEDGLPTTLVYQWYNNGVAISGATTADYVLTQMDVGGKISVRVSYTDLQGANETLLSTETTPVLNVNDPPTGTLAITGGAIEGSILNANLGFSDGDGLTGTFAIQWYRDGAAISGATGINYMLVQADVGKQISVDVTYTDARGTLENIASAPTAVVANINDNPVGNLLILGTVSEGETLTIFNDITDEDGLSGPLNYQWYRNNVAVAGATGVTYTLSQDDVDSEISLRLTYTDDFGYVENFASAPTALVANANSAPTGNVTINGVALEGEILTALVGIADADGLPATVNYQWYRDGVAVVGATQQNYVLVQQDVGTAIHVVVSYTDLEGTAEQVVSGATTPVANLNNPPQGNVLIIGNISEGQTLTASTMLSDVDGLPATLTYQWYRDGVAITGATQTDYLLSAGDIGATISVAVNYVDLYGTAESVTSAATAPVANINDLPVGGVDITGVAREGELLSVSHNITDADGLPATLNYQWYRDGVAIVGATQADYLLVQSDVGKVISVAVQYVDLLGTAESVVSLGSAPVTNVNDVPVGSVTVSGAAAEGEILTANPMFADADGLPAQFNYQWLRDGVAITGANSANYSVIQADVGHSLSVAVSYIDNHGAEETLLSDGSAAVANRNNPPVGTVNIVGSLVEDQLLAAQLAFTDQDGLPPENVANSFTYQWYRGSEILVGENAATYQLSQADVGAVMSVEVTYQDNYGTIETVRSAMSAAIANLNELPVGELVIAGTAMEDQTLTASRQFSDADGLPDVFVYQWYRDGVAVNGATSAAYTLADADVGSRISAAVFYTDNYGQSETLTSAETVPVLAINDVAMGTINIIGNLVEGDILTANSSVTDADGIPGVVVWQWYRDGAPIAAANAGNYQLTAADIGASIAVGVSYTDDQGYDEAVMSSAVGPVAAFNYLPQGKLLLTGIPVPGQILYLASTITDGNGIVGEIQFIWQRDGEPVLNVTGPQYEITEADRGATISVLAIYVDARGFEEMVLSNLMDIPAIPSPLPEVENAAPPPADTVIPAAVPSSSIEAAGQDPEPDATGEEPAPLQVAQDPPYTAGGEGHYDRPGNSIFDNSEAATTASFFSFSGLNNQGVHNRLENAAAALTAGAEKVLTGSALGSIIPSLNESIALLNNPQYSSDVSQAVEGIKDSHNSLTAAIVGGTAAVSTGLSVGYVIWTLRSGILMTGLLSSLPAWRFIDPLPILSGKTNDENDEDDESLESLIAGETRAEVRPTKDTASTGVP